MTPNRRYELLIEFSKAALTGVLSQERPTGCPRCANYGSAGPNKERAKYVVAMADAVVDEIEAMLESNAPRAKEIP
jgi:hypothetical protein